MTASEQPARLEVRALAQQLGQARGDRVGHLAPVQAVAVEHAEQRRRAAAHKLVRQPRVLPKSLGFRLDLNPRAGARALQGS